MNRSASDLIARLNSRTIYADIVVQKKNAEEGRLLRPMYINDFSAGILANYVEGLVETTPQEFDRYIASAQGSPSLPQTPTAPTILYGTSASGEVTIVFTPGSDGGSAITNYEYSTDGGNSYNAFSPATGAVSTLTITGLTNGTTYSITLKGVNSVGSGAASDVIYITPLPGSQLVLFLDGAFVEDPSGGVWRDSSGKMKNGTIYNAPYWDNVNGGRYDFNGVNQYVGVSQGFNDFSTGITVLAFASFTSTPNTWERIIDFGNGAENNNILLSREGTTGNLKFQLYNGVSQAISLDVNLTNGIIEDSWGFYVARLDGTNYLLKNQNSSTTGTTSVLPASVVRTNNYIGRSNWAGDAYFKRYIGIVAIYSGALTDGEIGDFFNLYKARYFAVPAAPTSLVGTIGNGQVSIAFTAGSDGGSPITNYEYSINGGTSYSAFSPADTASPVVITGLTNGTTYSVRLRAVNVIGTGTASDVLSVTPATVPSAPTSLVATAGDGQVSIAFTAGATGGSAITNYKYSTDGGTSYSVFSPADTASPVVITGLTNGTTYQIKLRAVNAVGDGAESLAVSATPLPSGNVYTSPTSNVGVAIVTQSPFGSGYAYDFNGTSDYLTISGDDSWALGTGAFTIEWFQYQTDNNDYPRIFATESNTIGCSIENGLLYPWLNGSWPKGFQLNGHKNNWYHFALVRTSDGTLNVYKDGTSVGSDTASANITDNLSTLFIGVDKYSPVFNTWFGGYLTNIRIVKGLAVYTGNFTKPTSALTLTAAANPYGGSNTVAIPAGFTKLLLVPDAFPVIDGKTLLFRLEGNNTTSYPGSGTTWFDIDGGTTAYNGTLVNTPTFDSSTAGGVFTFDRTQSEYVQIADNVSLRATTGASNYKSVVIWVYNTTDTSTGIFSKQSSSNDFDGYSITFNTNRRLTLNMNGRSVNGNYVTPSTNVYNLSEWTMITGIVCFGGSTGNPSKLYVNTTEVLSVANNESGVVETNPIRFPEGIQGYSSYSSCSIGAVYYYNGVLTSSDISALYNGTKARYGL